MPRRRLPLLLVGTAAVMAGCGGRAASAPTTSAPTTSTSTTTSTTSTTSTTVPAPTTTTLPADPQPTPLDAASVFIDGWESGSRARSATVAVPAAVATLFATPYAGQTVINRQCSVEFLPRVCSFGPYGGGSGTLYQVDLMPKGSDWYVSAAQVLP